MVDTIGDDSEGTPVSMAAAALGMSADALRKRIKRGTVSGFSRGGRVFVNTDWLEEIQGRSRPGDSERNGDVAGAVMELQRSELSRLVRDNAVLNEHVERLLKIQEREQVLRQQMQNVVERLGEQRSLPPPEALSLDVAQLKRRLIEAETEFSALKSAVAELVALLIRRGSH